jgi:hypothetical protein
MNYINVDAKLYENRLHNILYAFIRGKCLAGVGSDPNVAELCVHEHGFVISRK